MKFSEDVEKQREMSLKKRQAKVAKKAQKKRDEEARKIAKNAETIKKELPKVIRKLMRNATENYSNGHTAEASRNAPSKLRHIPSLAYTRGFDGENHHKLVKQIMEDCGAQDWDLAVIGSGLDPAYDYYTSEFRLSAK